MQKIVIEIVIENGKEWGTHPSIPLLRRNLGYQLTNHTYFSGMHSYVYHQVE